MMIRRLSLILLVMLGCISVWGQEIPSNTVYITDIAWNNDFTHLAVVGVHPGFSIVPGGVIQNPGYSPDRNSFGYINVTNMISGEVVFTITTPSSFTSVVWSPDNTRLALGSFAGTVWIVDATTGERITNLFGHEATVTDIDWNSSGTQIVSSGNWDELVIVWDAITYETVSKPETIGFPSSVRFSPNDQSLILGTDAGLYLFPVGLTDRSEIYRNYQISENWTTSLSISNDGTRIVAGTVAIRNIVSGLRPPAIVYVIDANSGTVITQIASDHGSIRNVQWSPDNAYIIVSSEDDITQVLDASTGTVQTEFPTSGRYTTGIEFSEYGGQLIYGNSFDGSVFSQDETIQSAALPSPIQMIVPIATLDRFTEIATSCGAPTSLIALNTSLQSETAIASEAQQLEAQLDTLPEGTIPASCEADLHAIVQAIVSEQSSP
jgi:WD40 repeat protein